MNVCENSMKLAEWNRIYIEKSQTKTAACEDKQKKVKWDEEKQSWCVGDWMKVIFSDESRIYIGQDSHTGILVSNEMYKDDCLMKQISSSHWWYRIVCHLKGIKGFLKEKSDMASKQFRSKSN